jgi:signal transduction histidine kinase
MQLDGDNPAHFAQIAFPREHVIFDTVLEEFVTDIAWIWIPFVCLLLLVNILVLKFALKPLSQAAEEARQIGPSSIAARLTETGMPEDVLALVSAVNEALDRLQAGFLSLEQFSSHLAHELRTPLAIIKARLALSQDAFARKVEEDFEGVERLVSQLVDRVRIGGLHFETSDLVDLGDIGQRAAAFLAPVILAKGRDIELQSPLEPVVVSGAFDFIFRALRNLIENALNHTPPGTTITVTIFRYGITVSDSGPGYPARWLEPAVAVGKPDSGAGGLGLGLSIVKETMIAHGGDLKLANLPEGGASATMEFSIHQNAS